ncbi:chloroplastic,Copper-transporting ATPase PAA1 [Trichinella spiralis]|uniref:Chloroplastic,Copper-transporting ATPase PAA1 n=2 Tax=Trichinella spiralis TaxID=6334 RepID=A0ABR3KHR0_TRISP
MKAAYAKQKQSKQAARRPGKQASQHDQRCSFINRCCPLCSGLITPTFVTASARSGRRRAPHSAGDDYCRPLTINRYALIGSPTGQSTATRRHGQPRAQQ